MGTAVVCAGVDRGSSCTCGSVCAVSGMLREQIWGKIMPMFSWAITRCYPCSPLQPPHARSALLPVWDQQLRPHRQERGWEIPSLPPEQGLQRQFLSSRMAGAVSQPPRAEGKGWVYLQAFPCRWLFNQAVCTLYAFCGVLFGLCSLTSLTVLSTVCCLKVCYPAYGRCWDVLSDLYLHPSLLT